MKKFACAYTVQEGRNTKVKVFWTRAEDVSIARANFTFFREEQCKQHIVATYPMHNMDKVLSSTK